MQVIELVSWSFSSSFRRYFKALKLPYMIFCAFFLLSFIETLLRILIYIQHCHCVIPRHHFYAYSCSEVNVSGEDFSGHPVDTAISLISYFT